MVVLAVLVLMAAVAAITTWEARKAGAQLDRAIDTYIPAYASLARADVRSLEQALALRRLVIADLAGVADEALRTRLRSEFDAKGADLARELAAARHLIATEVTSTSPFVDVAALAQLDARLEVLEDERGAVRCPSRCRAGEARRRRSPRPHRRARPVGETARRAEREVGAGADQDAGADAGGGIADPSGAGPRGADQHRCERACSDPRPRPRGHHDRRSGASGQAPAGRNPRDRDRGVGYRDPGDVVRRDRRIDDRFQSHGR